MLGIVVSSCLGGERGRGRKQEFQSPEVTSCRWVGVGSGVASKLCPHQMCTQSIKAGAGEGGTESSGKQREPGRLPHVIYGPGTARPTH